MIKPTQTIDKEVHKWRHIYKIKTKEIKSIHMYKKVKDTHFPFTNEIMQREENKDK